MDRYKDFSNVLDNPYKMPDMEYRGYTIKCQSVGKKDVYFRFCRDDECCGDGANYIECINQIDKIEGKNNVKILANN